MSIEQAIQGKIFRFWVIIALVIVLAVVPASALSFTAVTAGIPQGALAGTGEPGLTFTPAQAFFVQQAGLQPAILSTGLVLQATKTSPALRFPPGTGGSDLGAGTACSGNRQSGGTALHISPQEEDEKIRAVQEYIRQNNLSWIAGKTSVSNLTPAAYTALRGLKHPAPGESFPVRKISTASATSGTALPASFDWRNNGGDWTTPVRDQGGCGSCWAFASTATFESFWERLQNNPGLNPDFAEQYLVSCDSEDFGCGGGYSSSLGYFVNKAGTSGGVGTVVESDYPYTFDNWYSGCKSLTGKTRYAVPAGGSWNYLAGDCVISPVAETKQAIYTFGPLNAYINATDNFFAYKSGIFEDPSFIDGGACGTDHVVQLVGWGHDPVKDKDYWIAKNSYGTGWGEDGWFKVYTDQVRVGEGVAYLAAKPTVTSISPTKGATSGNTLVTITGAGFSGATAVTFGARAGTTMTVFSSTKINVTSPAHTAGVVNVRVITPYGTSAISATDRFTYAARPTVTAILPTNGSTAGGSRVTLTGTGLTGATAVTFGAKAGTTMTVFSSTKINVTSPAHTAGMVNVKVATPGGTSALSTADRFTYSAPPKVTGISPKNGSTAGDTLVTVTGTGFTGATAVTFGTTPGTSRTVVNATTITVRSPAHAAGVVYVRVTTPYGTSALAAGDRFTYT